MHLKSLTLRGFKSFASTTVFEFDPKINAVVGPNGSGKSNLVDALTWVMGEQGAKSLRGGSMQDLIFAGTSSRGALGRAKVTLVIDNSDAELDVPLTEIEISRTMFRSGGSEYELNGSPVRLSDIQDLLAETGLGKNHHSIVGQGQIDRALHATAADRRALIEEAAGILKHRRRAEKTERKLESMKANLDRLEDLEAELASQLEPLSEQAATARNAREIQAQVRDLRAQLLAADAAELLAEQKIQDDRAAAIRARKAEAEKSLEASVTAGTALESDLAKNATALKEHRLALANLEKIAASAQATLAIARERLRGGVEEDETSLNERLEAAQKSLATEEAELTLWSQKLKTLEERLAAQKETADRADSRVQELEKNLAETDRARTGYRDQLAQLTADLAAARASYERSLAEKDERAKELESAQTAIARVGEDTEAVLAELESSQAELAELEGSEQETRASRRQIAGHLEDLNKELTQAKLALEALVSRKKTLEESLVAATDLPAEAKRLYSAIKVEPGWEKAVSLALATYAEAAVTDTPTAKQYSQIFAPSQPAKTSKPKNLPHFALPALEALEAEPDVLPALEAALAATVLVPAGTSRAELEAFFTENPGYTAVTAEGLLHTSFALVYPSTAGGSIELSAQLAETQEKIGRAQLALDEIQQTHTQVSQGLAEVRTAEKTLAQAGGRARAELAKFQAKLASVQSRQESARSEITRLTKRAEAANQAERTAATRLEEAGEKLDTLMAAKPAENSATLKAELAKAQEEKTLIQSELASLSAQHQGALEQKTAFSARLLQAQEALEALKKSLETAQQVRAERAHKKQVARLNERKTIALLRALDAELDSSRTGQQELEENRTELGDRREALADERASLRLALEEIISQLGQTGIVRAKLEAKSEALAEKVSEEIGSDLDELLADFDPETFDRARAEAELVEGQKQLAALGAVNPLALEEFSALEERHRYLREQISDLKKSRADMRSLLKDLNSHIRESFEQAFADTKANFETIFAQVFPGGEGTLVLTDPAHPLDTGIDIEARPAGKKVKRLSLLSGGERALASLALLTAIFAARPSPFYVLDEVEAALDDRNLSRVLEVFKRLAEKSQLVIITHKPRTVEIADVLYGVSMQDGVSRVISQRAEVMRELL